MKEIFKEIDIFSILDYLSDNISKIIAIALAPLIQKIILKLYNKLKFLIAKKNYLDYENKTFKINKICEKLLFKCNASRVLFIALHNGDVTFSNLHLCKTTCLVEVVDLGISETKQDIVNQLVYNLDEYKHKPSKTKIIIEPDIFSMKNETQRQNLKLKGVKSFIEVLISVQDFPIGFLRLEYCNKIVDDKTLYDYSKEVLEESNTLKYLLKP